MKRGEKLFLLVLVGLLFWTEATAQEPTLLELPSEEVLQRLDSLRLSAGLDEETFAPRNLFRGYEIESLAADRRENLRENARQNIETMRRPLWMPTVMQWENGGIYGFASSMELRGMMAKEMANVGLVQRVGNVTFSVGGYAEKLVWYQGLQTYYGINGAVDWRINSTLSLHLFGKWQPGGYGSFFGSPTSTAAMMAYLPYNNFGLTLGIDFNEHWGVDVGAQAYQEIGTSRYHVAPVVAPYYRFNNGQKIGIDVGGILYELLRSKAGWDRGNPTIRPPGGIGSTPVAPRR